MIQISREDIARFPEGERFGVIQYRKNRKSYLGIIARRTGPNLHILNVGEELTVDAIEKWVKDTLELMNAKNSDDVEAPDMYERKH